MIVMLHGLYSFIAWIRISYKPQNLGKVETKVQVKDISKVDLDIFAPLPAIETFRILEAICSWFQRNI